MINLEHFDLISVFSGLLWLVIIVLLAAWHYSGIRHLSHARFFLPTVYFKIFGAIGFSAVYLGYYEGGDTFAYWDGAVSLTNLFYESPSDFLSEMWTQSDLVNLRLRFNSTTGFPPGWIYREPESFFVSKVLFFISIITFKSYWAATIILAYISARISFVLFTTLTKLNLHSHKLLAFGILFVPSVAFWCAGVSKDTIVFAALMLFTHEIISIYYLNKKIGLWSIFIILLCFFLMFKIRIYVIVTMVPALLIAYTRVIDLKNKTNQLRRVALKTVFYSLGIVTILLYTRVSSGGINQVFEEIIITQQDFANNPTYGDNRYSIQLEDFSISSVVFSIPNALVAAIYRPFLWESLNLTLLMNGLEGTILLFLTFRFFSSQLRQKIKIIRNSELLIFSLVFVLIMGFSVGFTSGLFGVLVRLKAVILPYFILLMSVQVMEKESDELASESLEKG
jgi:hypothetical protein